jgi:hypothetical protein
MDKRSGIGNIRGLNLAAVRPTIVQLTNCSFGVKVKSYPCAQRIKHYVMEVYGGVDV